MRLTAFVLLLITFFTGCEKPAYKPENPVLALPELNLVNLFEITDSVEQDFFPGHLSKVFQHDDKIILWDSRHDLIFILDESGTVLQRLGNKGSGPGEYKSITIISFGKNGRIHLYDSLNKRILTFEYDGKLWGLHKEIALQNIRHRSYSNIFELPDERFIVVAYNNSPLNTDKSKIVQIVDQQDKLVQDSLLVMPERERFAFTGASGYVYQAFSVFEYHAVNVLRTDFDGNLYYAFTNELKIMKSDLGQLGSFNPYIQQSFPRVEITEEIKREIISRYKFMFDNEPQRLPAFTNSIPNYKTAFQRFEIDNQGYVWVLINSNNPGQDWIRFDADGNLLHRLHIPSTDYVLNFHDQRIFLSHQTEEGLFILKVKKWSI